MRDEGLSISCTNIDSSQDHTYFVRVSLKGKLSLHQVMPHGINAVTSEFVFPGGCSDCKSQRVLSTRPMLDLVVDLHGHVGEQGWLRASEGVSALVFEDLASS